MLPGPVFRVELLTTARRARYYALRVAYGLILLAVIGSNYGAVFGGARAGARYSIAQMAYFADAMFRAFASAQMLVVLGLTPALVAGTIAEEKHRRTLHHLLASHLSSAEVVVGKLAARLLHVGSFLALGLPVVSLLSLFGGVEPRRVLMTYTVQALLAFAVAGQSILVSAVARRAREAIAWAYGLIPAWFVVPLLLGMAAEIWWVTFGGWDGWASRAFRGLSTLWALAMGLGDQPTPEMRYAWTALGLIVGWGTLGIIVATLRLRPIAARQEVKSRLEIRLDETGRRRFRLRPLPPVGDDAMLWKELHTSRVGGLLRLAGFLASLFVCVLLGCIVFEGMRDALREAFQGAGQEAITHVRRVEFNRILRDAISLICGFWVLRTALASATGISGEREEDTWISLVATTLTGREILRAKMIGAVARFKLGGLLLVALLAVGVLCWAVHPLAAVGVIAEFGAVLWFATALGTYVSLRSRTTLRSLGLTLGTLLFLGGGFLLLLVPLRSEPLARMLAFPFLVGDSLFSPWEGEVEYRGYGYYLGPPPELVAMVAVFVTLAYAAAAAALTFKAFRRFDVAVDRPRRPARPGWPATDQPSRVLPWGEVAAAD